MFEKYANALKSAYDRIPPGDQDEFRVRLLLSIYVGTMMPIMSLSYWCWQPPLRIYILPIGMVLLWFFATKFASKK